MRTKVTNTCKGSCCSGCGILCCLVGVAMNRIGSGTAGSYVDIIHCIGSFYRYFANEITEVHTECLNDPSHKGLGYIHCSNGIALCIYLPTFSIYSVSFGITACMSHIIGFQIDLITGIYRDGDIHIQFETDL